MYININTPIERYTSAAYSLNVARWNARAHIRNQLTITVTL